MHAVSIYNLKRHISVNLGHFRMTLPRLQPKQHPNLKFLEFERVKEIFKKDIKYGYRTQYVPKKSPASKGINHKHVLKLNAFTNVFQYFETCACSYRDKEYVSIQEFFESQSSGFQLAKKYCLSQRLLPTNLQNTHTQATLSVQYIRFLPFPYPNLIRNYLEFVRERK